MDDLISRQAAIDQLHQSYNLLDAEQRLEDLPSERTEVTEEAIKDYCRKRCLTILTNDYFHTLTSAQPEPLTDKEQRIFLSAMSREEEVCKQVDDEWRDCREPYEDSLVRTCHEITRKVKGSLWT